MNRNSIYCRVAADKSVLSRDEAGNRLAKIASSIAFSLFLLLFPVMILAQSGSGVTGVVSDQSGGVIPGVEVTLTDTKTSRVLTTKTNDQGVYRFDNVPPGGGYRLSFTVQGFQTSVINDVALGIGRIESQNAEMTPGEVSGTVTVTTTGGEATLNTTDASIGNVINERQLRELPILLRDNPAALIGLQPGVIGNNVGTGNVNRVGSVTGSRADQGNITVDGIDSNDQATGQAFVTIGNIPIDSVQEFRAVTTNPGSNEGRSSGGQIQIGTKSGSNDFHGSLREYYRDERTAANTFFNNRVGTPRPQLRRHQFGGSISGPLPFFNFGEGGPAFHSGKNRSFFFFDYEGRRDNSQTSVLRTVPLQHFREGRIGYINTNAGCGATSRLDTTPNCISFLTPAQVAALDPQGVGVNQALLSFINNRYPLPNDLSAGNGVNTGGYRYNAPFTLTSNTFTPRVDWNITENQRWFGRVIITRFDQTNAFQVFPGDGDAQRLIDKSLNLASGHTWVINPSFTNVFTFGLAQQAWDFPVPSSAAFPTIFGTFGPLTAPYASISFQDRDVIVPTFRDDVTLNLGTHTFTFGGQYKPIRQKATLVNDFNFATLGLGGNLTALDATTRPGNLLASTSARSNFDTAFTFLLGRLASLSTNYTYNTTGVVNPLGSGRKTDYVYDETELYAQDSWRIRNDLTVNLGVRWHYYPAPYEKNGVQASNDVDYDELVARRIANANAGIAGNSAEPFLTYDLIGKANDARPLYETDTNNFGYRASFAYNPSFRGGLLGAMFGERKTVIRGGFTKVYDRVGGALTFIQNQSSYLFDNSAARNFGSTSVNNVARLSLLADPRFTGISTLPVSNTAPTITRPFTPYVENGIGIGLDLGGSTFNYAIAQNFEIPYSYQWSLGFQREVPGNMLLDVSYVGRRGKKLIAQADASQALNFRDPVSGQTMFDAFNAVQSQLNAGTPVANLTPQPWLENQLRAGIQQFYGNFGCNAFGLGANCTQLVANFQPALVQTGGAADLVQILYRNGLLRPNVGLSSQFAVNAYITNLGESQYDGLLVSLQKRFSRGFEFDVNYTWSHAIDNNSSVANSSTGGLICDITNLQACRGDADFDIRHLFNVNGIWDLPFGRGRAFGNDMPKFLDAIVGGWTMSGIFTARSGLPITSLSGSYPVGFFLDSPSVLVGNGASFDANIRDEGTGIQYFADPEAVLAALRYPRHGESGNRNIFRSEGFYQLDMVLSKKFQMPWSENHRLTFRAEAYNVTNSHFFGTPNLVLNSTTFGRVTTSQSTPRQFQFALRYDF